MRTCRSCAAPIVWVEMVETGKRMPVDAQPVQPAAFDQMLGLVAVPDHPVEKSLVVSQYTTIGQLRDRRLHVSHFATCPNAAIHRRQRQRQEQLRVSAEPDPDSWEAARR